MLVFFLFLSIFFLPWFRAHYIFEITIIAVDWLIRCIFFLLADGRIQKSWFNLCLIIYIYFLMFVKMGFCFVTCTYLGVYEVYMKYLWYIIYILDVTKITKCNMKSSCCLNLYAKLKFVWSWEAILPFILVIFVYFISGSELIDPFSFKMPICIHMSSFEIMSNLIYIIGVWSLEKNQNKYKVSVFYNQFLYAMLVYFKINNFIHSLRKHPH